MSKRAWPVLVVLVLGLTACGSQTGTTAQPADHSYDGPLYESRDQAMYPRAGAAGDVVACRNFGSGGFEDAAEYASGATADSADRALEVARSEGGFLEWVLDGLRVAAKTPDRLLYVLEVAGEAKQAVIVHDGPATEGAGGPGWYVESWARCDWSEMPPSATDAFGLQVWTDRDGVPVSTKEMASYVGPEHCNWQSATFLQLGDSWRDSYVRNPPDELTDFLAGPYREHVPLPDDAVATPYRREGDRLWLAGDQMTAYVGADTSDVEAWPRAVEPIGCE